MTYEMFRQALEAMVEEIPDVFLQDLQGIHALEEECAEDGYQDVFRMGEYLDPGPDDFLGGSDGLGRHVALYWGSFKAIAEDDPDFDWEEELWETLTHELQHHVESLAGDGRLIEEDLKQARAWTNAADEEPVSLGATRHDVHARQDWAQRVDTRVGARIRRWFARSGRRDVPSEEDA
jgi:hypothetical protein